MPIPIEKLREIKTIVSHKDCPDGLASAMVLKDVLPDAEVIFLQHKTPEHAALNPTPGMIFCDFVPVPERAQEFVDAGAIVLDHHRTARSIVEMFGDLGVFADENTEPGIAGASLAYREVWLPIAEEQQYHPRAKRAPGTRDYILGKNYVRHFTRLAGIRDTWQRHSPLWREACRQAEVLRFVPPENWLDGFEFWNQTEMEKQLGIGEALLQRRDAMVKTMIEAAFRFKTPAGTRVAVVPTIETSDVAEAIEDADLVVGFAYRFRSQQGPFGVGSVILSTRGRGKFDCARFCKVYGGGGHTNAAGCSIELQQNDVQPYTYIQRFIEQYEQVVIPG